MIAKSEMASTRRDINSLCRLEPAGCSASNCPPPSTVHAKAGDTAHICTPDQPVRLSAHCLELTAYVLVKRVNHVTDITASEISNEAPLHHQQQRTDATCNRQSRAQLSFAKLSCKGSSSILSPSQHLMTSNGSNADRLYCASPPVCFSAVLYFCAHGKKTRKES